MPVEIREMVVKAIIPSQDHQDAEDAKKMPMLESPMSNAHVIEECVAAVMRILEKRERR
jgi:hypothetical protein